MSGTCWPAAGRRSDASGTLGAVGNWVGYWSSTRSNAYQSYYLYFDYNGGVTPSSNYVRSYALSVRCVQERGALFITPWDGGSGSVGALFFAGIPRLRSG